MTLDEVPERRLSDERRARPDRRVGDGATLDDAVVLAAGEGVRLRPLTRNRPKPMLPAANRPVLEYVFDALVDAGVERLHVVVGYKRDRVQDHFGAAYRGVRVDYLGQSKQLGSGHALLQARDAVEGGFLAVNGDQIIEAGMAAAVADAFEDARGSSPTDDPAAALAIVERDEAGRYGAVTLRDEEITTLVEKPGTDEFGLLNAGVYAFDERVFDAIEDAPRVDGERSLSDAVSRFVDGDEVVRGVRTDGLWVDATYPWDLLALARDLLTRGRVNEPEYGADRDGASSRGSAHVADSARVDASAVLQPPVALGADCEVGPNAVVGPDAALGRNVVVKAGSVVARSVLDADARVGRGATLEDCVVGQGVHVGAGTTVPGGPGDVRVDGEIVEDAPLGALLADRVRIEGDVGVAPGTLVGPNATVRTGATVSGTVPEGSDVMR